MQKTEEKILSEGNEAMSMCLCLNLTLSQRTPASSPYLLHLVGSSFN